MVIGLCLGWGFGAAAMRAALASRNQLLLKQALEQEAQRSTYAYLFPTTASLTRSAALQVFRTPMLFSLLTFSRDVSWTRSKDSFFGCFCDLLTFVSSSSIVFGCFLGLASFFFALIRAYAPKLTILSVFATIAVDLFCVSINLSPIAYY